MDLELNPMIRIAVASLLFVSVAGLAVRADDAPATSKAQRVFEMRTYHCNEGKLPDLQKRFREHTCDLFKKHGMDLIGFWTPRDAKDGKADTLVYILAYPSKEAADASWKAFRDDPEWKKVLEESHKNGVLVKKVDSVYLDPTDYSAIK